MEKKECKHKKFKDSEGKCFLCDEKWTKEDEQIDKDNLLQELQNNKYDKQT